MVLAKLATADVQRLLQMRSGIALQPQTFESHAYGFTEGCFPFRLAREELLYSGAGLAHHLRYRNVLALAKDMGGGDLPRRSKPRERLQLHGVDGTQHLVEERIDRLRSVGLARSLHPCGIRIGSLQRHRITGIHHSKVHRRTDDQRDDQHDEHGGQCGKHARVTSGECPLPTRRLSGSAARGLFPTL